MASPAPLAGRVALVTGASRRSAIRAAVVRRLVADGAAVLVHSWDLADPETPARLVAAARESFGQLDIVIAHHARSARQSLEELTAAELDLTHAVNTRATLLLVQEFAAQYEPGAGGRVVVFTSGQYHGVMPAELPYIASKGGTAGADADPRRAPHRPRDHGQLRQPRPQQHRPRRRRRLGVDRRAQPRRPGEHASGHRSPCRMAGQRRSRVGERPGHRL